jgi:hypothetical protein
VARVIGGRKLGKAIEALSETDQALGAAEAEPQALTAIAFEATIAESSGTRLVGELAQQSGQLETQAMLLAGDSDQGVRELPGILDLGDRRVGLDVLGGWNLTEDDWCL